MKKDIFSESERLAFLSSKFREMFDLWGYREIFLPTVESLDERLRKGIKLVHNDEIYVVKPDLTSQILEDLKKKRKTKLTKPSSKLPGKRKKKKKKK